MIVMWIITVGGYGSFEFEGTEQEAEEMRQHKASWEGAPAKKELKEGTDEKVPNH